MLFGAEMMLRIDLFLLFKSALTLSIPLAVIFAIPAVSASKCPLQPGNAVVNLVSFEGDLVIHNDLDRYDLERMRREKTTRSLEQNWWPVGFTVANKHFNLKSQAKIVDLGNNFFCGVLSEVTAKLEFPRIDVYVSSEFRPGSCPYRETLNHENIHVSIFRDTLKHFSGVLRNEIEHAVRESSAVTASSAQIVVDELQRRIKERVDPQIQLMERQHREANAAIDTKENYRREQMKCPLW
jgi:hypothetical protein